MDPTTEIVYRWIVAHETIAPSMRTFLKAVGNDRENRRRVIRESVTMVVSPFGGSLTALLLRDAMDRVNWDELGDALAEVLRE